MKEDKFNSVVNYYYEKYINSKFQKVLSVVDCQAKLGSPAILVKEDKSNSVVNSYYEKYDKTKFQKALSV